MIHRGRSCAGELSEVEGELGKYQDLARELRLIRNMMVRIVATIVGSVAKKYKNWKYMKDYTDNDVTGGLRFDLSFFFINETI